MVWFTAAAEGTVEILVIRGEYPLTDQKIEPVM